MQVEKEDVEKYLAGKDFDYSSSDRWPEFLNYDHSNTVGSNNTEENEEGFNWYETNVNIKGTQYIIYSYPLDFNTSDYSTWTITYADNEREFDELNFWFLVRKNKIKNIPTEEI